jgi:hypothetical protein
VESRKGFEVALELTVKAHVLGYQVAEVPSSWEDRSAGQSRFRLWSSLPRYLHWAIYCTLRSILPRKRTGNKQAPRA